jgi:two-component system cell cycle sensor histidine kinase/response regulator CckA
MLLARAAFEGGFDFAFLQQLVPEEFMSKFSAVSEEAPDSWLAPPVALLPGAEATELKRTRQALAANEILLRQFVQHTPAAVAMFDARMCCIQASDRWLTDYGLEGRDIAGLTYLEMFPELPDRWKAVHHNVLAGATEQCERDTIVRRDGSVEWLQWEARPWHKTDASVGGLILFTQFITERIHIEEALRLSQDKFRSAMQHSPIGMAVVGPDGRWLEVNPALCKIVGYSRGELLVANFDDPTHPEDREKGVHFRRQMLERQIENYQIEKRYLHKNGQVVWVQLNVSLAWNPDGTPRHFVAQIQDVTERKRAEEQRKKLEEQLRQAQKMEALGTLAGGTAHEFNNILGIIIGYSDLAKLELADGHPVARHLEEVLKASLRAKEIVQQILTFTRQQKDQRELVFLHPIVEDTVNLVRTTLPETVQIVTDIDPGANAILGNPTQIHQVILNLCTNAWHAMKNGAGLIRIALRMVTLDQTAPALHAALHAGPYVRLAIEDNGEGMDAGTQARIFEPFFTTKGPGKGTGLGLAVVHGILQAHDGAVVVRSQPGQGTTFHLYFPAELAAPVKSPLAGPASMPSGAGQHILLVDDEPALAQSTTLALARLGYRVTGVHSSSEALKVFHLQPTEIDLVITDLTMPGMNGIELANALHDFLPDLPIILASGFGGMRTANFANGPGARAVLQKPYTTEMLARTVQLMLAGSSES